MLAAAVLWLVLVQADGLDSAPNLAPPPISSPADTQPPAASGPLRIPAGTEVQIELVDSVGSATSHLGDKFALRLAEPIMVGGKSVLAAGATGQGEVIDAGRAGMGGRQGKLVISARFLDLPGRRVRIRGLTLQASGKGRVNLAVGAMIVFSPAPLFIDGDEITMPAGTRATAKLAEDVELPSSPPTEVKGEQ